MTPLDPGLLLAVRERVAAMDGAVDHRVLAGILRDLGVVEDRFRLEQLTRVLQGELVGLGPLEDLLNDPGVTDVVVNGPDRVWVDRGSGLERAGVRFRDEAAVRALAVRLAERAGRRLDDATPYVDARMPGGQRLHAVLPPLSVRGTAISLRIPSRRRLGLADLVAAGSLDAAGAQWLASLVHSRAAFLVSGGTGSGKTSVLGALLGLVPGSERIVIVEDTCELDPDHPHVVSLESRAPNLEGRGAVPMEVLVRQALRMRPDRLVVGEVRGAEVVDMLAALNTGHEGGCGTVHANSAEAVPERLAALALAAGMPRDGVHAQVAAGVEVVVHLARRPDGARVVEQVGVVHEADGRAFVLPALLRGRQAGGFRPGPGYERLARRVGAPAVAGAA